MRWLLVVAALAAIFPRPVSADPITAIDFGIQCTQGPFRACADVNIWTAADSYGGTSLFVNIANVQGRRGFEDLPGFVGLGHFSIVGAEYECAPSPEFLWGDDSEFCEDQYIDERAGDFSTALHPTMVNGVASYLFSDSEVSAHRLPEQYLQGPSIEGDVRVGYIYQMDSEAYMWGCNVPTGAEGHSLSTCDSDVHWEFNMGPVTHISLTERTYLRLSFRSVTDDIQWLGTAQCTTAITDLDNCVRVPEPSTALLLMPSFLLLTLLGRRRRAGRSVAA